MAARKDVSNPSGAHKTMAPRIALVNALMGGTDAMRDAGTTYLPQYEMESDKAFQARLGRAVLTNFFGRTVEGLVGKPFSKPLVIGDDMPAQLDDLMEDVDQQGSHINVFARKVFRDGLVKGLTHVLVDYPQADPNVQTVADEKALGNRPYFVHIPNENILAAYAEMRGGVEFLVHVRIYEMETRRDEFDEITIERVRVLEPGTWTLWRKEKQRWVVEGSGATSLDFIPLVTWYADREDFMVANPPLTDLAHLNIAHWQSASDQRNVLTVSRFPILAGSGISEEEGKQVIGPNKYLTSSDKDAKWYFVEHSGAAIAAGRQDMEDLKSEMALLGVELLMPKPTGQQTATAKIIDTAENHSNLQAMAMTFGDFLEQAFSFAGQWLGLKAEDSGSISINADFGLKLNDAQDLTALTAARAAKEISHEAFVGELQRRGVLADDFDLEADTKLLDDEKLKGLADQAFVAGLQADGTLPAPAPPAPGGPPQNQPPKGDKAQ